MGKDQQRRQTILKHISDERDRQDEKWGGKEHDLNHPKSIWTRLIVRQLGDADRALECGDVDDYGNQMVQVAALAVAALECLEIEYEDDELLTEGRLIDILVDDEENDD